LKYVHSAGVIHRDLKPSNILVNENCDLKICDFGLARIQDPQMTGYVSTRYYRAPEIMLTWQKYDVEVDIWSVGCIFAEMLEGKPLFPGKDHVNQFSIITDLLGTPPDDVIKTICSENVRMNVPLAAMTKSNPYLRHCDSSNPYQNENVSHLRRNLRTSILWVRKEAFVLGPALTLFSAIDMLEKMLVFNPKSRITAGEALAHPYLSPYHDASDEPVADEKFDWSFNDADLPVDTWKIMMYVSLFIFLQLV
jgi:p38 MAP kinase